MNKQLKKSIRRTKTGLFQRGKTVYDRSREKRQGHHYARKK